VPLLAGHLVERHGRTVGTLGGHDPDEVLAVPLGHRHLVTGDQGDHRGGGPLSRLRALRRGVVRGERGAGRRHEGGGRRGGDDDLADGPAAWPGRPACTSLHH
jgi:hypothetical protein